MTKNRIILGIVVVIIAGGAFYAGNVYGKGQTPSRTGGTFVAGAGGFAGRTGTRTGAAGGFTTGQILSVGQGSVTIQEQSGSSSEIVLVSDTTQITKSVSGAMSDLTPGTSIIVTGSTNSDGSITAQSIQIRPAGMTGGFSGGTSRTGTQTQTQ